jgi:putative ABC transport system permease protein
MGGFLQNLRFGARLAGRNPGLSTICVLTLGVGIGLTATMFSIVHGLLLRSLPFVEPERLVAVTHTDVAQGTEGIDIPLPAFALYRAEQQAFEDLAGYRTGTFNVSGGEVAEQFSGGWVTANTFELLRVQPILGLSFRPQEAGAGAELVTVIGYRIWQDRFGGDPQVLGRTLRINGEAATVVGVMPEGFMFPIREALWVPDRRDASEYEVGASGAPSLSVFGRLRPGVALEQASAQVSALSQRLAASDAETYGNVRAVAITLDEQFRRWVIGNHGRELLFTMLGAVFLVLLIACVNVANLLLGRAALRSREVAIRTALGASRSRIVAQFLTEPLILAAAGALLGLAIVWVGASVFARSIPAESTVYWVDFGVDRTVLLFVVGLMLFATLVSGLLPALRASGGNAGETLKDGTRGASSVRGGRITRGLVVAEIALAVVILASAGLMIRSAVNATSLEYPFPTEDVLTARLGFPLEYPAYTRVDERIRFFEEVESRLAGVPGVRQAALTSTLPGEWANSIGVAVEGRVEERAADRSAARWAAVTPAFFDLFEVRMIEGRTFGAEDHAESLPVVIVNESFARRHFPAGDAVGSRLRYGSAADAPWRTIVGIAPDLYMAGGEREQQEQEGFYFPLAQATGARFMSIVARTAGPPSSITAQVREAVAAVDRDIPIYRVQTLGAALRDGLWDLRVVGTMFSIMGAVALFLATIGLYGVIAFAVSRRTREMGIRMALGAGAGKVLRLVIRQGVVQLAAGLAIGLLATFAVTGLLHSFLVGVGPRDPVTLLAIIAALGVTGLLATWVPARRATRVDPLVALRAE